MLYGESDSFKHGVGSFMCRLCVETPFAGGHVFETGEEKFLKLGLKGESLKVDILLPIANRFLSAYRCCLYQV